MEISFQGKKVSVGGIDVLVNNASGVGMTDDESGCKGESQHRTAARSTLDGAAATLA